MVEHSGGRDSDVYGAHKDFDSLMSKFRTRCVAPTLRSRLWAQGCGSAERLLQWARDE